MAPGLALFMSGGQAIGAGGASPSSQNGEQLSLGCDRQVANAPMAPAASQQLPEGVETPPLISRCFLGTQDGWDWVGHNTWH